MRRFILVLLPSIVAGVLLIGSAPMRAADADADAERIAKATMEKMGGAEAWDSTRFVTWRFFGGRLHTWDKHTGDIRIDSPAREADGESPERPAILVLMNIQTMEGQVWTDGELVTDAEKLAEYLDVGHQWWVNDSYWMFMPYKLLDPGVTLRHTGERALEDGRLADVLEMTFGEDIGYTPENRYEVLVARDTGLVEAWTFYASAADEEPRFTMPWADWKQFGQIRLATSHGQGRQWDIAVPDSVPPTTFTTP